MRVKRATNTTTSRRASSQSFHHIRLTKCNILQDGNEGVSYEVGDEEGDEDAPGPVRLSINELRARLLKLLWQSGKGSGGSSLTALLLGDVGNTLEHVYVLTYPKHDRR